ncbi:Hypp5698 [Branchiostoma lanceolatum]|uniref:Hypp5698 protein n=1 Tax=Branchiostoma lanceolatum TaxID=7740 RepID=A0A8J9WG53_BRALA|nr:Hypp5698 [Branchiostoma lanceolatum]
METSAAGKRKLRRRAQKRPLTEDEENGGSTSAKKRASYDPKASSAFTEVDKKSRKTKRKVSTRGNKKVCLEENDVEVTKENTQGLQKLPDDKEKLKIEHDTNPIESIVLSGSTKTKEEVENQTLDNHKSSSSVRKATETTPSSTEQAKYVPKFGKRTKRKQAGMQAKEPIEEEHSDTATNVETVQIVSTEDSGPKQKQEVITTISTLVDEEKKAATTKVDTKETVSTATTVETVQILSMDNSNLGQKQEDITTSSVVDEEKKTVPEDEVLIATTEADTLKTLSTEGTSLTNSLQQEGITTASTAKVADEEQNTVSEDKVLTATTEADTLKTLSTEGTSLTDNLVQKQEGITTTSTVKVVNEEQNTVLEDEVVIVSIEFDSVEALSTEFTCTSISNNLVQEQKDTVSTGKIIDEDNSVTENNVAGGVNTGDTENQHTSGGTVVSSTLQASDIEPETVATRKPQKQDEIGTAKEEKEATCSNNLAPQNSKPQTVKEGNDSVSAPLTEPDHNTDTAEEKVVRTEHEDAASCEMSSVPVVEVARDVLSTIIEKIISEEAVVCTRNDSSTLEVTVSTKSQGMEESSEGRPGIDSDEKKVGQKDDDPNTSASDAQEATLAIVSTVSQGKDGTSRGGDDCSEKKFGQKDDGSPDSSVSDAQETTERSNCGEGTKQQGNEQKDSSPTNKTLETNTTEHSDQEDSQGLDNFMDTLSSSQLYQMELEALTTAQQINAAPAKQEPDEGARKAILRLTSDLSSLNRSVMSVWREFNALQKKRLARKKEQAAKASRGLPNAFRTDTATSKPVQNGCQGGNIRTQVAQRNPSPMKIRNDKKVAFSHLDQQKKMDQHNIRPKSSQATNNGQRGSNSRGQVAQQNPSPMKIRNDKRVAFSHLDQQKKMDQHNIRPKSSQATNNGQRGSNSRGQVAQQNPSPMKIRNDKTVVFNNINQQKKMDQHKIRTPSLQAMKNRQQSRLLPMPKPTGRLPFQATTSQRQPQGTSGLYQNTSSSRGSQLVPPNRKPQNGSTPAKGSSSNNPFNFTPTKPAQGNSSVKMSVLQAAPSSRTGGSHNLMSCPSVNNRSFAR